MKTKKIIVPTDREVYVPAGTQLIFNRNGWQSFAFKKNGSIYYCTLEGDGITSLVEGDFEEITKEELNKMLTMLK
jgi:hypothetical protein